MYFGTHTSGFRSFIYASDSDVPRLVRRQVGNDCVSTCVSTCVYLTTSSFIYTQGSKETGRLHAHVAVSTHTCMCVYLVVRRQIHTQVARSFIYIRLNYMCMYLHIYT